LTEIAFQMLSQGLGVHLAPCAVLLDFFSGFVAPAGAQSGAPKSWLTWGGGVNYKAGDYLTSSIFELMYPVGHPATALFPEPLTDLND
jgi:hypothetical protein